MTRSGEPQKKQGDKSAYQFLDLSHFSRRLRILAPLYTPRRNHSHAPAGVKLDVSAQPRIRYPERDRRPRGVFVDEAVTSKHGRRGYMELEALTITM